MEKQYKVLFADMDGTLIRTRSGNDHPTDINDWLLKDDVIENIYKMGIERLHIVSNQGGISKGYFTKKDINRKINNICMAIQSFGSSGYCPFFVTYDFCETDNRHDIKRKPNTGMFDNFMRVFGKYKKDDCLMLGDASGKEGDFSDSDLKAAENFGIDYIDVNDFVNEEK